MARLARHVRIDEAAIAAYAASLPLGEAQAMDPDIDSAAFWLTLDAINFGSGWFPTLRKRDGRSGYYTICAGLHDQFTRQGAWGPEELAAMSPETIAAVLGQDPDHELMALFARSLQDLGTRISRAGGFAAVVDGAGSSAAALVATLAAWECFADTSRYGGLELPFLKRAQIAAADLYRSGAADFADLDRLTLFADNLVPHVLRLDGVLWFDPDLVARIEGGELIEPGSPEEVEIRACALHAVELIASARCGPCPADIDQLLWLRGQRPEYKARPRHRCQCTAY